MTLPATALQLRSLLHASGVMRIGVLQRLDDIIYDARLRATMPRTLDDRFTSIDKFRAALDTKDTTIPASALYGWAALDLGIPYVNFTPSLGSSLPRR